MDDQVGAWDVVNGVMGVDRDIVDWIAAGVQGLAVVALGITLVKLMLHQTGLGLFRVVRGLSQVLVACGRVGFQRG